jgi:hypothetical protein
MNDYSLTPAMHTKSGVYIFALHLRDEVILVGQCTDMQQKIDDLVKDNKIQFDRFTHSFLEGVEPGTDLANTMEAIAIVKLRPLLNTELPATENYCTDLKDFCARYNGIDSTIFSVSLHSLQETVKRQELLPLYEKTGKTYYRTLDLLALVAQATSKPQPIRASIFSEKEQAA